MPPLHFWRGGGGCWSLKLGQWSHLLLQQFYEFLPHGVWCFVVQWLLKESYVSWRINLYHHARPFFIPDNIPCFEVALSEINIATFAFFFKISVSLAYFYLSIYFSSVCVFIFQIGFLYTPYNWPCFLIHSDKSLSLFFFFINFIMKFFIQKSWKNWTMRYICP